MSELPLHHRLLRFANKVRVLGLRRAWDSVRAIFRQPAGPAFPLASANRDLMLAGSLNALRDYARAQSERQTVEKGFVPQNIAAYFPFEYTAEDRTLRYAFFPALNTSRGVVVVFHGHVGSDIHPIRYSWPEFDLLLPLDNFGWNNLGSWFWGELGDNFVERLTAGLIEKIRAERAAPAWYCIGASMGGFAALYYALKYRADGVYAMAPVIDLKGKIRDNRSQNIAGAYTHLARPDDEDLHALPDIYAAAAACDHLPPLFLVQHQYDRLNLFGTKTLPLVQLYNERRAWAGLRVHPAIGHTGHDGSYEEAQHFFALLSEKQPPFMVDYL